jgi:hypothetical protein
MVENSDDYPDKIFSMYEDQVLVGGSALSSTPNAGDWVVDMSSGDTVPHFGNKVTIEPNLPEGIETKHLSLLANQAVIDGQGYGLTLSGATAGDLSRVLQERVAEVMGKSSFEEVTDEDLLAKLKEQVATIREQATQASDDSITSSLDDVNALIEQIDAAMGDGTFTPDLTVEIAFESYREALANVSSARNTSDRTAAIEDLQAAHDALVTVFEQDAAQQLDTYQESLDTASEAIETARQASQRMDFITNEYESTEQAESIQEYEDSMKGVDTTATAAAEEM